MGRIVVTNNLSLDGVMQSPARPDEDDRDGFDRGGWAIPYNDEVSGKFMAQRSQGEGKGEGAMLFGRITYEDFSKVWPNMPSENPFANILNNRQKYVASTTLDEPLGWQNSTLLGGDAAEAIGELKERMDLVILGSGSLIQSLIPHGLIDEFVLSIHPLLLGKGRRLFSDNGPAVELEMTDSVPTTTGVVINTYRVI